jgi:hypothetical protein
LTVSRASFEVAISFRAAVRGISTAMQSSAARMVAPRRRPDIRPTSPKIDPSPIGTVMAGLTGLISTLTEPEAMPNSDDPIA